MLKTWGRYTAVIFTTIIFIVLVVSVLTINFSLSFQTEANAEVVNIAGRQRMLSQRVAKSLGNVKARYLNGEPYSKQKKELVSSTELFNTTINAFKNGGNTLSTKVGQSYLKAVEDGAGLSAVNEALDIWQPLYLSIQDLSNQLDNIEKRTHPAPELAVKLSEAQSYVDNNINALLKLMNDLTNYNESLSNEAANRSRLIQAAGILASMLCFAIIMYLILGQLRTADRATTSARRETQQIFKTVDQGLFLINQDLTMGSEHSKALESIFSATEFEGREFLTFIKPSISSSDLDKVARYLRLLFDPHKKQKLLRHLNPLNQLTVQVEENGVIHDKYLNFSFSRVTDNKEIVGVLSSVSDITKEVILEKELEAESQKNAQQLEMISTLMGADSDLLPEFLDKSDKAYFKLNNLLRNPAQTSLEFRKKADSMLSLIHKVKGDSAALGLDFVSKTCNNFEDQVESLSRKSDVAGGEFLSLTVLLDQLFSINEQISSVFNAVLRHSSNNNAAPVRDDTNAKLNQLARSIAHRQNKSIHLSIAGFDSYTITPQKKLDIVSLASQLLRNAVSHGIELPEERVSSGKLADGQIVLALYDQGSRGYRLICEDDGKGLDFQELAKKAINEGLISEVDETKVSPSQVTNLLLTERLSIKTHANEDSGRGVGLNVVSDLSTSLGGKMSLQTKPSGGTRFTIRFSKD